MDNSSGAVGEAYVSEMLKSKGYKIVGRNFRTRFGEIDIIASDDKYIIFVEVKTREKGSMVSPVEAVTKSKQRKLISAAKGFLSAHHVSLQPRFDVAALETSGKEIISVNYISNAFMC
jgi:putative endonuclease